MEAGETGMALNTVLVRSTLSLQLFRYILLSAYANDDLTGIKLGLTGMFVLWSVFVFVNIVYFFLFPLDRRQNHRLLFTPYFDFCLQPSYASKPELVFRKLSSGGC